MNTLVLMALLSTNGVNLSWDGIPLAHYRLVTSTSLSTPLSSWTTVTNVLGTNGIMTLQVPNSSKEKYYELIVRTNPLAGKTLYIETNTPASRQIALWSVTRPSDAQQLHKIADQSTTSWINSPSDVTKITSTFAKCGTNVPTFMLYYMYHRDILAGLSSGGAPTPALYTNWINSCKTAINGRECRLVLEPDSIASLPDPKLNVAEKETRLQLLTYAVDTLTASPKSHVYPEIGHPRWHADPSILVPYLKRIGIQKTSGFAQNVANYVLTSECITYGKRLSVMLDHIHFIIDTSRNGRGPGTTWCDATGRGLGPKPTIGYIDPYVDGFFYGKYPGEADGCDAPAGTWLPERALELSKNAVQ
jgi:endoglucanase